MDHDPPSQDLHRVDSSQPRTESMPSEGLFCVSCDYDLRGLEVEGDCPECGRPIVSSINPPEALAGDLRWTKRAARSMRLFVRGIAVSLLAVPLGALAASRQGAPSLWRWIPLLASLVCFALWGNVLWALTARHKTLDSGMAEPEPRRVARMTFIVSCTGGAAVLLLPYPGWVPWWIVAAIVLALPVGITGPVGAWGWSRRIQQIAQLADDEAAAQRVQRDFRSFAGGYWTSVGLLALATVFGPLPVLLSFITVMIALVSLVVLLLAPLRLWINEKWPSSSQEAPSPAPRS